MTWASKVLVKLWASFTINSYQIHKNPSCPCERFETVWRQNCWCSLCFIVSNSSPVRNYFKHVLSCWSRVPVLTSLWPGLGISALLIDEDGEKVKQFWKKYPSYKIYGLVDVGLRLSTWECIFVNMQNVLSFQLCVLPKMAFQCVSVDGKWNWPKPTWTKTHLFLVYFCGCVSASHTGLEKLLNCSGPFLCFSLEKKCSAYEAIFKNDK